MRIPIYKEFLEKARSEGLPMFRLQIDWRFVPKEKRSLKCYESCGYLSLEEAARLFRFSMSDFVEKARART